MHNAPLTKIFNSDKADYVERSFGDASWSWGALAIRLARGKFRGDITNNIKEGRKDYWKYFGRDTTYDKECIEWIKDTFSSI